MGWTSICRCLCWKSKISTHIPLRGWTNRNYRNIQFISFQHTPPHGGWTFLFGSPWKIIKDFNPHPVWGWTDSFWTKLLVGSITTHTPVWGWTQIRLKARPKCNYFNPHPRRGMNLISSCILAPYFLLQPTPPHGGWTTLIKRRQWSFEISILTPVWGWMRYYWIQ